MFNTLISAHKLEILLLEKDLTLVKEMIFLLPVKNKILNIFHP